MQQNDREAHPAADLVLRGGDVLALDTRDTRATAIAIRHGRIVRVGDDADVLPLIGRRTRVIDLDGRAVLPGINDSHVHAAWLGAVWPKTFFGDGTNAAPENDPHEIASVDRLLSSHDDRRAALLRAGRLLSSFGITSYTEPGIGPGELYGATGCFGPEIFDAYVSLEAERALPARVNVLALFGMVDGPSSLHEFSAGLRGLVRDTERPAWLRVAGVKIFGDGIPPMQQAWTRHRYPDGSQGGLLVDGSDEREREANLRAMIRQAHRAGLQIGVHATGDRTIETVVDEVALTMAKTPADLGHYVIHGDLASPQTIERMRSLGMGLNMQAGIATATAPWVTGVLGEAATTASWQFAAAMQAGVLSLTSDAPILAPDWRVGIAAADAWMGPVVGNDARTSRMLGLLRAYTVSPARQDAASAWKGTIEANKVADLVVLAANPLDVDPVDLPEVAVDYTILDGEVAFERALASALE